MVLLFLSLLAGPAAAGTVVYGSVSGALGFTLHNVGDFAVGAEQLLGEHHGLLAEGTYIHVHGNPTHATTYGLQLGYRFHRAPIDAPFVGLVAGFEDGYAKVDKAEHGGPIWRYELRHLSLVPHVGYRWGLGERLALTVRFGAGYGRFDVSTEEPDAQAEVTALLEDRLQFTPIKLDSELSIGFRF